MSWGRPSPRRTVCFSAVGLEFTAKRLGSEDLSRTKLRAVPQTADLSEKEGGPGTRRTRPCHVLTQRLTAGVVEPGAKNRKLWFEPPEQVHCCNAPRSAVL